MRQVTSSTSMAFAFWDHMSNSTHRSEGCITVSVGKHHEGKAKAVLDQSNYCLAESIIHPKYTVRKGHEIYNIGVTKLITATAWLPPMPS